MGLITTEKAFINFRYFRNYFSVIKMDNSDARRRLIHTIVYKEPCFHEMRVWEGGGCNPCTMLVETRASIFVRGDQHAQLSVAMAGRVKECWT